MIYYNGTYLSGHRESASISSVEKELKGVKNIWLPEGGKDDHFRFLLPFFYNGTD